MRVEEWGCLPVCVEVSLDVRHGLFHGAAGGWGGQNVWPVCLCVPPVFPPVGSLGASPDGRNAGEWPVSFGAGRRPKRLCSGAVRLMQVVVP